MGVKQKTGSKVSEVRKVVIDAGAKEEDAKPASIEEEMKVDVVAGNEEIVSDDKEDDPGVEEDEDEVLVIVPPLEGEGKFE